ncbi:MAG: pyruvate formate lyase family protein, partial [Deltaproteobacteria bacterium]
DGSRLKVATETLDGPPLDHARIDRLRDRYQTGRATLSIQRARHYTRSWQETAGEDMSPVLRVATAMHRVYAGMEHHVDPDDRIAGHWTEGFFGLPIDIERGVFNTVLQTELRTRDMAVARVRAIAKVASYVSRKRGIGAFLGEQRQARASGAAPLDMGLKTLARRKINPFDISTADRRELLEDLLPFWKSKTAVDRLQAALEEAGLITQDTLDFAMSVPGNTSRQVLMLSTAATISTIQGHVILDYASVLRHGLAGLREQVSRRLAGAGLTSTQQDTLRALDLSLDGVALFARRLGDRIETQLAGDPDADRRLVLAEMLRNCRRVPLNPATSFAEAIQSIWIVKTAVELAHPVNLHCFGRLDQDLYAYYQRDLDAGRISPADAQTLIEELLLKIMSQNIRPESNILGNFYHRFFGSSPVTLAGSHADGSDATNALTYLFVRAAHRCRAVTNISLRITDSTPDDLLLLVARCMHDGTSSFSFFNDATHVEAMKRRGFSEADARDYAIMGCVEATCPGKTGSMSASALLLSRMLDITLRNGDARTPIGLMTGEGPATGDPDGFQSFDLLLEAYLEQGRTAIARIVEGSNIRDRVYADTLPAPLISAFMDGCVDRAADVTRGGARYDLAGISLINSIANATDALYAIKKLVYEQKRYSVRQILDAIDDNYVGHEALHRAVMQVKDKWGNGKAESDGIARRIMEGLIQETYRYRNAKGGPFVVYAISMTTHTIDGRLSIASADGRKAATPYAASCNPNNVEESGVTGVLRSVASLPHDDIMGCAVNVRFHPSGIGHNEQARQKWVALLRTYFRLGGAQMQPTAVDAETLRAAQARPALYKDLIVKVGGYSTYFVDLGREIQDEVIARTEHAA